MLKILYLSVFVLVTVSGKAQYFCSNFAWGTTFVFPEKANLYKAPSVDSAVVAVVGFLSSVNPYPYGEIQDTLDGQVGRWLYVEYEDKPGYIWQSDLATSDVLIRSIHNNRLLFCQEGDELHIKSLRNDKLNKSFRMPLGDGVTFEFAFTIGETYNSEGKEVLILRSYKSLESTIEMYTWDGEELEVFDKGLPDSSFAEKDYQAKEEIVADNVRFRLGASFESTVIRRLNFGEQVEVVHHFYQKDTLSGEVSWWTQLVHQKDTGFVWYPYVSTYSIKSFVEEGVRFVFQQAPYENGDVLFAVKNNEILDSTRFQPIWRFEALHSLGDIGLKGVKELVAVCYTTSTCGSCGGDVYLTWDGKKLGSFAADWCCADIEDYSCHNVHLPTPDEAGSGLVQIDESYCYEVYHYPTGIEFYCSTSLLRNYVYEGDSLREIESDTRKVERLLEKDFSGWKPAWFEKGDINGDGYSDLVVLTRYGQDMEEESSSSMIVIYCSDQQGSYSLQTHSKTLVAEGLLTKVKILNKGFELCIHDRGNQYHMSYQYDKKADDMILKKVTCYAPAEYDQGAHGAYYYDEDTEWTKSELHYRKNKVHFKNSHYKGFEKRY